MRVQGELQVRDDVAHLGPLVEGEAADDVVRDTGAPQSFFEEARLGVRAVEHGGAQVGFRASVLLDLRGDEARLALGVHGLVVADGRAGGVGRPEGLVLALGVVLDDGVGRVEDGLRGAVVLFELDDARLGVVLLEVEYVRDVRAAPAVD